MLQKTKELTFYRITEFEGLRALLAWWVFFGHALVFSGFTDSKSLPFFIRGLLANGYAVDIFIILSGFVIFLLLDRNSDKSYIQFMTERLFRIYPIFIISLVVGIALVPLETNVFTHATWNDLNISSIHLRIIENGYNYFPYQLISHLTLLHGVIPDQILPDSSLTFIHQAWSLSLEWQFYLIAPLLITIFRKSSSIWIYFILLILAILLRKIFSHFSYGFGAFLPIKMEFFAIGILSYYFCKQVQEKSFKINLNIILPASILVMILLALSPYKEIVSRAVPCSIWLIALSASIVRIEKLNTKGLLLVSRFLNHPILQDLGRFSYSTYLIHTLIIYFLMWLTFVVSPDANRIIVLLVQVLVGATVTVIVSFGLYRFVEKPFIYLGKQVSSRMKWSQRS